MTQDRRDSPDKSDIFRTFTNEDQDPAVVRVVHERVQQILTSGETILYIAVQKKPVLNLTPECVVLTNRRFLAYRPKLMGRVIIEDHAWRDLLDARLQENVLGATLTLKTVRGEPISVDHLPKAQARRLYAFSQEMEERVREERRARELEDKRAAAGGVVVSGVPLTGGSPQAGPPDPVQRLKSLKEMLDSGLISSSEYETKRAEIISKM